MVSLIPSPSVGVWHLGPVPIRAYALAILVGIIVAWWMGARRYAARGGQADKILDIAIWAVPFGIVGGRLYHVLTDWGDYFGPGGHPWRALAIWEGGLGVWGAVALGAVGVWLGTRQAGLRLAPVADAVAPGVLVAQGIGRLGNWFNQELFGKPTTLPWGLRVDQAHRPAGAAPGTLYQPTFLYEMVWDFLAAGLLMAIDKKCKLGHGRVVALYVALYCAGRGCVEMLRIDPAHHILGLRLNVWTAGLVGIGALVCFIVQSHRRPGRDTELYRPGRAPATPSAPAAASVGSDDWAALRGEGDHAASSTREKADRVDAVGETDRADDAGRPGGAGSGTEAGIRPGRAEDR
ncbi:MAG: prolipoprotein diacylglyceryl transferase [Bifidobacteriaceae bacterium]|nr:prolipoprotein diacylglyceryl transferase [Bifidobacteriaceae bacterium]